MVAVGDGGGVNLDPDMSGRSEPVEPGGIGGIMIGLGFLVLALGTFTSRAQDA